VIKEANKNNPNTFASSFTLNDLVTPTIPGVFSGLPRVGVGCDRSFKGLNVLLKMSLQTHSLMDCWSTSADKIIETGLIINKIFL
jgi:hypothetical protein